MPSDPIPGAVVTIKVRDDGPLKVTGPVQIVDVDGGVFALPAGESVVLCRCGLSGDKPFCDRSHRGVFADRSRADDGGADGGTGIPSSDR